MFARFLGWALVVLMIGAAPNAAHAQLFLASDPHPPFTIGPLFIRASVAPNLNPITIDIFWSLVVSPRRGAVPPRGDLSLLWPGPVQGDPTLGPPDRELIRYLADRGFTNIDEGRLRLFARSVGQAGRTEPESVVSGAPFVTFVRQGGSMGLTAPATYILIPWSPKLADRSWLMDLRMTVNGLVKREKGSWIETLFRGPRYTVALSFADVRSRGLFPLYLEHRDRVVHLSEDPSQLVLNFAEADHLKIDEVSPASASQRLSETLESTQVVSMFLDRAEGLKPQVLSVRFGYFSWIQAWTPILIPVGFFILGNIAGMLTSRAVLRVARGIAARVHVARPKEGQRGRQRGVVLSRETLARIKPGETTRDEVLRLCGPDAEEHEDLESPEHRTLVYRGVRLVPHRRLSVGWLATVSHWDVEHHETEIAFDGDRVRDVQARVRRSRLPSPQLV